MFWLCSGKIFSLFHQNFNSLTYNIVSWHPEFHIFVSFIFSSFKHLVWIYLNVIVFRFVAISFLDFFEGFFFFSFLDLLTINLFHAVSDAWGGNSEELSGICRHGTCLASELYGLFSFLFPHVYLVYFLFVAYFHDYSQHLTVASEEHLYSIVHVLIFMEVYYHLSSSIMICTWKFYTTFNNSFVFLFSFQDKHEENHQPKLHGGLVIKHNANQRYATNAVTSIIFREIAHLHNLPVQVSSFCN